jgi:hypothetical protein
MSSHLPITAGAPLVSKRSLRVAAFHDEAGGYFAILRNPQGEVVRFFTAPTGPKWPKTKATHAREKARRRGGAR